jgi:hypothetical protein
VGAALAFARDHLAGERGFAGQLALDRGAAGDAPGARTERQHIHLDAQLVSRRDRPAEFGPLDAGENHQLFFPVGDLGQHDHPAGLGHRLHHQNAGHDGIAGEMALKERLVDGDIFDRHQPPGRLEFDDPVDEQKRVAVG